MPCVAVNFVKIRYNFAFILYFLGFILRLSIFIICVFVLLFVGISSSLPNAHYVGGIGEFIGHFNHDFFGGFGVIYPFILLYPAYKIYKNHHKFSWLLGSQIVGGILLFLSILLGLSMIKSSLGGVFGTFFYDSFKGDIGALGCFFMALVGFLIGFGLCFKERFDIALLKAFVLKASQIKEQVSQPKPAPKTAKKQVLKSSKSEFSENSKSLENSENSKDISDISENSNTEFYEISELLEPEFSENSNPAGRKQNSENSKDISENSKDNSENSKENSENLENSKNPNSPKITAKGVEILSEVAENKEILAQIEKGKQEKPRDFKLPSLEFLTPAPKKAKGVSETEIDKKIADLLEKLRKFKIEGDVIRTYSGPVVTTFEFKPAASVPVRKILNLQDDLAMALKAQTIRIQAPIPGKDVVGIEIPNSEIQTIYLREILESELFTNSKSELTMALGKDIVGDPFITDLKKLPHLLIAGTTGSGKSVGINSMILSLLYRNSPKTLKLVMVDPKILEFSMYNDIPHLLTPVITEPKKAVTVLANLVVEMDRRYTLMAATHSKNIESYNEKMKASGGQTFPFIVVIIDELADLMMTAGKEVEISIARIAQKARASGIHLIIATQRPSVDVVTGLIKANLPSRISYRVGQKIDSKVILDQLGAESLLGRGDMLFTPPGSPGLVRLHAPFASEGEIDKIVEFLKEQGEPEYDESFIKDDSGSAASGGGASGELDELYEQAKEVILSEKKTSISYLQRRLTIGYNRAANIIEQLEQNGVLGPANAKGQREIL